MAKVVSLLRNEPQVPYDDFFGFRSQFSDRSHTQSLFFLSPSRTSRVANLDLSRSALEVWEGGKYADEQVSSGVAHGYAHNMRMNRFRQALPMGYAHNMRMNTFRQALPMGYAHATVSSLY